MSRPIFFLFPNSHNSRVIHLTWPCQWILPFVTHKVFWKELKYLLFQNSLMLLKLQIHVLFSFCNTQCPARKTSRTWTTTRENLCILAYWFPKLFSKRTNLDWHYSLNSSWNSVILLGRLLPRKVAHGKTSENLENAGHRFIKKVARQLLLKLCGQNQW